MIDFSMKAPAAGGLATVTCSTGIPVLLPKTQTCAFSIFTTFRASNGHQTTSISLSQTVLSIFRWPSRSWTARRLRGSPVDESGLGPPLADISEKVRATSRSQVFQTVGAPLRIRTRGLIFRSLGGWAAAGLLLESARGRAVPVRNSNRRFNRKTCALLARQHQQSRFLAGQERREQ